MTAPVALAKLHGCRRFRFFTRPWPGRLKPAPGGVLHDALAPQQGQRTATPVNVPLLDLVAQYNGIKDDVLRAMMTVVERQGFIMGPEVAQLEEEVARLSGTRHAIGCASGTDALLLPLRALDMRPGDEVITTAFTFFATAGAIHNAGGTPVFVDIDPATFNISPRAIQDGITSRTRGIIAVHLFGQMAPMEEIVPLARRHGHNLFQDRKSTRLNSSHVQPSRMPSSA